MKSIKNVLKDLEEKYEQLLNQLEVQRVDGCVIVDAREGKVSYYLQKYDVKEKVCRRRYLKKSEMNLVKSYAQSNYDVRVKNLLEKRVAQLKKINRDFVDDEIDEIFDKMILERQELIRPVQVTKQEKIRKWKETEYIGLGFAEDGAEIFSKKGERVRSKSEKILADKFYDLKIEYKYECPLKLKSGKIIYPDFTFLRPDDLEEIYWEHFGMMDNSQYAMAALRKIELYHKNGIFLGERLITTFEYAKNKVDFDVADKIIKRLLQYS